MQNYFKKIILFTLLFLACLPVFAMTPSDNYYSKQWYLEKIKADKAWEKVKESPEIIIAVIDSGIQINHPDLVANIWHNPDEAPDNNIDDDKNGYIDDVSGWNFIENNNNPNPNLQNKFSEGGILHGTLVSGLAGAIGNNALGISGVSWKIKIMPLKALSDQGEGRTDLIAKAIDYAVKNDADILNLSFTGFDYSYTLAEAIKRAHQAGLIIVAAAGNEEDQGDGYLLDQKPLYPVCYDGPKGENWVIGVAATDALDQKANFSSYGFDCLDLSAPGESIFGLAAYFPGQIINGRILDKYADGYWSGTSMAVPLVSGAIALIKAVNPSLNNKAVINLLLNNTDNINALNSKYAGKLGNGRLNIYNSVSQAQELLNSQKVKIISFPQKEVNPLRMTGINKEDAQDFFPFDKNFSGGGSLASCTFSPGNASLVIGSGSGPQVRIFTPGGKLIGQFLAFDKSFKGLTNVACGDLSGDGIDKIIVGAGNAGNSQVKIFTAQGKLLGQFLAFDKKFRGGISLASGDVDGDGLAEIAVAPLQGGGPHLKIFDSRGNLKSSFFVFEKSFRGGVNLSIGEVFSGGGFRKEIVVVPASEKTVEVKIFNYKGKILKNFFAYAPNFQGGANLAVKDVNQDGLAEIITGAGPGGAPHVRVFKANSQLIGSFYVYNEDFRNGVRVEAIDIN